MAKRKAPRKRRRAAPKKKQRRRSRKSGMYGGGPGGIPVKEMAVAGAVGFVLQTDPAANSTVKKIQDQLNKLPPLGNRTVTAGLALHFGNKFTLKNKWLALAGKVMLIGGAFAIGRKKFVQSQALLGESDDVTGWEGQMGAGVDDDNVPVQMSGHFDDDDDGDYHGTTVDADEVTGDDDDDGEDD